MTKQSFISLFLTLVLLVTACKNGNEEPARPFPTPQVPAMLGSNLQQAFQYISLHFWDKLYAPGVEYSKDTSLVMGVTPDDFEEAFAIYLTALDNVTLPVMKDAQDTMLTRATRYQLSHPESKIWKTIIELSEKYLYDPNSPYRNEEMFLPVLAHLIESPFNTDEEKMHYGHLHRLCSYNRIDTPAADFKYTLKNGRTGTLHHIKAEYVLLFFSNPECQNCKEIIDALATSPELTQLIQQKRLAILNIYPDADLAEWYDYLPNYPDNWINGYDQDLALNMQTIYNIRAIPSLYLLDKDKNVIFKDAPPEKIISWLIRMAD
ncbi:MAG: DUF5106 domain-containing protein [Bacteroidales bacterium]|jgi:thiol-disulfide isomerase/thioredoxin|nr:DUF5106 domain-containing protein [Bacteroidales bacterium]